jgi:hypothetical protein
VQLDPPPSQVHVLVGHRLLRFRLQPLGLEAAAFELGDHRVLAPGPGWIRCTRLGSIRTTEPELLF